MAVQKVKVLALTAANRLPDFSCVYGRLGQVARLDLKVLNKDEQRDLRRYLGQIDLAQYDRVIIDLLFKCVYRQSGVLSQIEGLLIYEQDACQNYLESSRWRGRFSRFYHRLPNARIVVTGASVAQRLRSEGLTAHFIAKGYDPQMVFCEAGERDIELGFIGRTASAAYAGRKKMLEQLAVDESLQLLRTEPGHSYRNMLNRIRYFVSADVGLGEYMAKNFEAMACGCVLLAWRQGSEEPAIGLQDGVHLLLYSDLDELREHLAGLRSDPARARAIADQGRRFVEAKMTHTHLAESLFEVLQQPWPQVRKPTAWRALCSRFNPF